MAATAWHWTDPELRYRAAWELLRPGGHLAFWAGVHVFPPGGDPFFREIQAVYDEIGEPLGRRGWPQPRELPDERGEIVATGLFEAATVTQFDWEVTYDAEGYIDLLETFSGHISMQPWQRERLHAEIRRRLAERPGGACAGTGAPRCTSRGGREARGRPVPGTAARIPGTRRLRRW